MQFSQALQEYILQWSFERVRKTQAHSAEVQFTFAVGSARQMQTRTFCRLPVFSMNVVALLTVLG